MISPQDSRVTHTHLRRSSGRGRRRAYYYRAETPRSFILMEDEVSLHAHCKVSTKVLWDRMGWGIWARWGGRGCAWVTTRTFKYRCNMKPSNGAPRMRFTAVTPHQLAA